MVLSEMVERWFPGARERGNGELVFNGDRISVLQDEEICEWMVVMTTQQYEYTLYFIVYIVYGTIHLKWLRWYLLCMCTLPQLKKKLIAATTMKICSQLSQIGFIGKQNLRGRLGY